VPATAKNAVREAPEAKALVSSHGWCVRTSGIAKFHSYGVARRDPLCAAEQQIDGRDVASGARVQRPPAHRPRCKLAKASQSIKSFAPGQCFTSYEPCCSYRQLPAARRR
jgi:hypothetical protein